MIKKISLILMFLSIALSQKPRARDLGIEFKGVPGKLNAMIAAETMEGINNNKVYALPHGKLMEILKQYNRAN